MLHGEGDVGLVYRSMKVYERTLQHGGTKAQEDRYGIGEKIVAWFTSSTAATKEKFLSSRHILNVTVPVMYAEGQEGAVWEWLAMLYSRNFGSGISYPGNDPDVSSRHPEWVIQEIDLIRFMIKEDLRRGRLDTAVLQFIKASDYMQRTGRMSSETQSSRNWQATINAMTFAILQRRHRHGLPDHLFDNLVEHRSLWSSSSTFASELVLLYHPTRPSAKELVNAINQAHDQVQVRFSRIETMREHGKKIILNSLLDGAQLLLEQKSNFVKEAQLILDLIEEQFPDMAAREGNEVTEKRIQSVRQIICPQEVMPTPIGIA